MDYLIRNNLVDSAAVGENNGLPQLIINLGKKNEPKFIFGILNRASASVESLNSECGRPKRVPA